MAGHLDTRQYSQDLCHLMQFKKPMFINHLGVGRLYALPKMAVLLCQNWRKVPLMAHLELVK